MTGIGGTPLRFACLKARRAICEDSVLSSVWPDCTAITSLEFALIALPFFTMVLSTFAVGLWFFYSSSLDVGVYLAARQILTGQFQNTAGSATLTPAQFTTTYLCPNMSNFVPCSAANPLVSITIVPAAGFAALATPGTTQKTDPTTNQTFTPLKLTIPSPSLCPPAPGSLVYIQAIYTMPVLPLGLSAFNVSLISGTTVKVEQFPVGTSTAQLCSTPGA
jgi:Flp pilus assembly protein TadG